jgi:diaminopimelate decarboxylase
MKRWPAVLTQRSAVRRSRRFAGSKISAWPSNRVDLVDQAGLSMFRVRAIRNVGDYLITTVEGQNFSLSEQWFNSEFLPDPLLISFHSSNAMPCLTSIAGCSCLDADMLTWRKIAFPDQPSPGDIVVNANTAGYQMDSNESSFHRLPIPPKVAVWSDGQSFRWCDDAKFHQID